jgi:hypothetical protein
MARYFTGQTNGLMNLEGMEETSFLGNSYNLVGLKEQSNFLNTPSDILKALLGSKEDCTTIGIQSTALGPEIIVTCVEDIIFEEGNTCVVLKHYDTSGYILPSHKIKLNEIEGVFPFATRFVNPYISNIDKDKTWFF